MDTSTEALPSSDVDTEMTVLTTADITEQNLDASDEVEHLRNRYKAEIFYSRQITAAQSQGSPC